MILIADAATATHELDTSLTNAFGEGRSYAHMSRLEDRFGLDQQAEVAGPLAPSRPL